MNSRSQNNQLQARTIPALDGWRGVAILLVLLWHLWPRNGEPTPWFISFGWAGVDLFFVLSGFLITRILLAARGREHYFRNFYARRTLRIFPLYYVSVFAVYILWPLVNSAPADWYHAGLGFAYLTNIWSAASHQWFPAPYPFNGSHLWSLAIEEQFYLLWPIIVLVLNRKPLMVFCAVLIAAAISGRVLASRLGLPQIVAYVSTPCHIDGLAIGALMAILATSGAWTRRAITASKLVLPVASMGLLMVFIGCRSFDVHTNPLVQTLGISLVAPFFASMMFLTIAEETGNALDRAMRFSLLRWFGKYSYGLYIFHGFLVVVFQGPVWQWTSSQLGTSLFIRISQLVFSVCGCSLIAFLSYHLFERQILKLKRRFKEPMSPNDREPHAAASDR